MERILVDLGSAADLLFLHALLRLGYEPKNPCDPKRVLVGFKGS